MSPSIYQERVYSPPSSQRRRNDYDADLDELQMANFIRQQEDEARVSIQRQVSEAQEDGMKARLPQNKRYFSQCSPPGSGYVDPLEHSPTELQHSIFMDDSTAQVGVINLASVYLFIYLFIFSCHFISQPYEKVGIIVTIK